MYYRSFIDQYMFISNNLKTLQFNFDMKILKDIEYQRQKP